MALEAQATSLFYQGRLTDQGSAANGHYEVRFQLFDAEVAGSVQGLAVTNVVAVTNGLFSTTLDFGDGVFDGGIRWMELGVRTNGAAESFVALSPRQLVGAAPQALYAERVGAAGITGVLPDSVMSSNIVRLDSDVVFTGAVKFTNKTNVFEGTFIGDGLGLHSLNPANSAGGIGGAMPALFGGVDSASEGATVSERVESDWSFPSGPPVGNVWRSLVPEKDAARQTNWCLVRRSAIWINSPWVQPVVPTGWPTLTSSEFVFGIDGSSFVVLLRGIGTHVRLAVDGGVDFFQTYTPVDVKTHYYTVTFPTSARRQIVLKLSGNYQFGGLYVPATNGVWPGVVARQHRMIVVGDSFSEDINSSSWTSYLMSLFRNLDVWSSSVGSTGYINPGSSGRVNFQARMTADVIVNRPDYVLFAGGINDNTTILTNGATADGLRDAALNCYRTIQTNLPNCKIIVLGPFFPRTPDTPSIFVVNNAISNACQIAGIGANYVDTIANPWVTGVWNQPGSGSAVRYTRTDGTHPTQEGAWNIAYRVASELTRRFPEFSPR